MHAIPTKYKGVQFRSRLEATWAAYFDLLGVRWEYEPFDLPGWIPDFRIEGSLGESFLVEVKYSSVEFGEAMHKASASCQTALEEVTVLFLGNGPSDSALAESYRKDDPFPGFGPSFDDWAFRKYRRVTKSLGSAPSLVLSGYGAHVGAPLREEETEGLAALWKEARNLTQYKAPK